MQISAHDVEGVRTVLTAIPGVHSVTEDETTPGMMVIHTTNSTDSGPTPEPLATTHPIDNVVLRTLLDHSTVSSFARVPETLQDRFRTSVDIAGPSDAEDGLDDEKRTKNGLYSRLTRRNRRNQSNRRRSG